MSLTPERTVEMRWRGTQSRAMQATAREVDVEGAIRAGKTTVCLWKENDFANTYPGIATLLARWTDDAVFGLIVPLWNTICEQAGNRQTWNSKEGCFDWPNGSRIYVRGLKTQDQTMRYSKLRGYTIARAYVDQAEELPHDIYLELAGRLSQKGYPHQITISPQAIEDTHWIAQEFPTDNSKPERVYFALSVYDNRHNLDESVIPALERLYPASHPKHKTLIQGVRGMNVVGVPVYQAAFVRQLHEGPAEYDPRLPLDMGLDFGKHHPCVVFRQTSALGQVRYLGGILGQSLYLDDFIDLVLRYRAEWFPNPVELRECCDPAGASDTSHGTQGAVKSLHAKGVHPMSQPDANSPAIRLAMVERIASRMRRRAANREEALLVSHSDRWLRISAQSTMVDRFLADGFEAGYVWDEHMVSVNNKQVRKPKKDGWYEHGQNCAEYLELHFGDGAPRKKADVSKALTVPGGPMSWLGT
jgi:Phage terminase large subunit